ncbi:hypothetical protein QSI_2971 [Clostridioides difficile P28]|nr:hypothetical protein QSI_2971 [Clostridioides difficile P28]
MQMILKALFWAFAYRHANAGQFLPACLCAHTSLYQPIALR